MASPPQYVYDNYKDIRDSDLILKKTINVNNVGDFEKQLNDAQPKTEDDQKNRSLIQYLYRKNPTNFCRFLVRSRLSHLILWTESKCIVRYFGLKGLVYVKWDDKEYKCSLHKNIDDNIENFADVSDNRHNETPYREDTDNNTRRLEYRSDRMTGNNYRRNQNSFRENNSRESGFRNNSYIRNNSRDYGNTYNTNVRKPYESNVRKPYESNVRKPYESNVRKPYESNKESKFESTNIYENIYLENTEENFPTLVENKSDSSSEIR
jgi:hypothetical protein